MNFKNLTQEIRNLMLEEINYDLVNNSLFISNRLTDKGSSLYVSFLKEAAALGDEVSLANALRGEGVISQTYVRKNPKSGMTTCKTPVNQAEMTAEGEFNRFYIRAICRSACNQGVSEVEIYRARAVQNPRSESEARIGITVNPSDLLSDLRENLGGDTVMGCPGGPNSGLSVCLKEV